MTACSSKRDAVSAMKLSMMRVTIADKVVVVSLGKKLLYSASHHKLPKWTLLFKISH